MPTVEFLSPGVFGIVVAPARAPEGLSPAIAGMVGWTEKGPTNTPIRVRSVEEYEERFGGISNMGLIPLEIRAFFGTGGQQAVVVRVVPSDAVAASVDVDDVPGPTKWTFTANGEGVWGNNLTVRIRGNPNHLNRTTATWEKFDVLILEPFELDPTILVATEVFEAVQLTDATGGDYIVKVLEDPRRPSELILITEGAGGVPTGLLSSAITDEDIGDGDGLAANFTGTLATTPVLDLTLEIRAAESQIDDEAQTPTPVPDSAATGFTFTLPSTPILDGSVRLFYAKAPAISNEAVTVVGAIDDANTIYTVAATSLSDSVHREGAVFRLKYAATGSASGPNLLHTDGGGGLAHDLSTTPLTVALPAHPGTVSLSIDIGGGPVLQLDDGAGNFPVTAELPAGGTINYDTGALTGITAPLLAASSITESHNTSSIITKAASVDNLATGVALAGAVTAGTIDLVDSVTTPTGSGPLSFTTSVSPTAGTSFYLDFVASGIIDSDVAGALSGDTGVGTNTVDFDTGAVDVELAVAALTGETIDADYQTGQIVTDDGLGRLIGAVDAAGNNTINYETGAFDVTFATAPLASTDILANYTSLEDSLDFPLAGGLDGTAVTRAEITAAALEANFEGIYAFDKFEEPLNVVVPDFEGITTIQNDIIDFVNARDDRFAILGVQNGLEPAEVVQYVLATQAGVFDTYKAAIYYPNTQFVREDTDSIETIPVTGFVAGVYAKTANNKNIGKAPAGIEDGLLDAPGTVGPERDLTLAERDLLYQARINPVFRSAATGYVVWGSKSLSTESRWRFVNASLLNNFLFFRIFRLLQFAVFENNGPALWLKVEQAVTGFLESLFRLGFFAGDTAQQAFFVKCDSSNNNDSTIAQGKVILDVGFAPNTPAQFIIFRLQQPLVQTAT